MAVTGVSFGFAIGGIVGLFQGAVLATGTLDTAVEGTLEDTVGLARRSYARVKVATGAVGRY